MFFSGFALKRHCHKGEWIYVSYEASPKAASSDQSAIAAKCIVAPPEKSHETAVQIELAQGFQAQTALPLPRSESYPLGWAVNANLKMLPRSENGANR